MAALSSLAFAVRRPLSSSKPESLNELTATIEGR